MVMDHPSDDVCYSGIRRPLRFKCARALEYRFNQEIHYFRLFHVMNHDNHVMARTSDIPFPALEITYEQYLHLASLLTTNDCITDAIEALTVFPLYSFDPKTLYGAVDGQKVAWQHILLYGHYIFQNSNEIIDLDVLVAGLKLGKRKFRWFRRRTPLLVLNEISQQHDVKKPTQCVSALRGLSAKDYSFNDQSERIIHEE